MTRVKLETVLVLAIIGCTSASRAVLQADAPSLSSSTDGICGDANTQVTICFPGNQSAATCEYGLSERADPSAGQANPCPIGQLFGQSCTTIPGLVFIAYGPCQDQLRLKDSAGAPAPVGSLESVQQSQPIENWIDSLGLYGLQQVGALYLRGYAYQPPQPVVGLDILPNLNKIGASNGLNTLVSDTTALTILGAEIPKLGFISAINGGLLIQNVPDQNFSGNFAPLEMVTGSLFIAGNTALTSLAGLEQLNSSAIGNMEILSNNLLTDISALSNALGCSSDGQTNVEPSTTLVGAIEVLPMNSNGTEHCLLSTVAQACEFIGSQMCPVGTANAYTQFQTTKDSSATALLISSAPAPSPF